MDKMKLVALFAIAAGLALAGLDGKEGWGAPAAKPSCATCHADFKSVLPQKHPPVSGKEIGACLTCHKPGSSDKAAPNPFSAGIHRPHTGAKAKAKVDCLTCHTWTAGKSFGLLSVKGSWGPLSKTDMALLKKTMASWSDSAYLDALHGKRNVSCAGCHAKRLPAESDTVETDRCLTCHDSYEKLAAKTASAEFPKRNPHSSHLVGLDCTKCHMVHGESKVYCLECHPTFNMKIPGGPAAQAGTGK